MSLPKRITNVPASGMKVCGHCQKEFPKNKDWFDRDSCKEDGFKNWCKKCRQERRNKQQLVEAASLMQKLDLSVVSNLSNSRPGGTDVPHAAEIYQNVMALFGGVQGFAMHWMGTFISAKPGSQTRERMLTGMQKLSQAVSDSNKVSMPSDLMSDEDLDKVMKEREARMRIVPAHVEDVTDDEANEQSEPDRGSAAG